MMPAIELSERERQNWIEFRKLTTITSHKAKKNRISQEEIERVRDTIANLDRDFSYSDLLEISSVHPVILKRVISILKNEGFIKKISNKYWRVVNDK